MKPKENLSSAVTECSDNQFFGTHRMSALDMNQFLSGHYRDFVGHNRRMVERLTPSRILPDDDLSGSVPAAHTDIAAYQSHTYTMTAGADFNATEVRHLRIAFACMHCTYWAGAAGHIAFCAVLAVGCLPHGCAGSHLKSGISSVASEHGFIGQLWYREVFDHAVDTTDL